MNLSDAVSKETVKYLSDNYPSEFKVWFSCFESEVKRLCEKWSMEITDCERFSRFGAILYGKSKAYGDTAIKVIPAFSQRLDTEIYCYKNLPYPQMCPFYDCDTDFGALLLKRVCEDADAPKSIKESVFAKMYLNRLPAKNGSIPLPAFTDVVREVLETAANRIELAGDDKLKVFNPIIKRTLEATDSLAGEPTYMVHGDAHTYNMLASSGECVLIDPLGYTAPFEVEYSRYLGTAIKFDLLTDIEFISLVKRIAPCETDIRKLLTVFAVDTTLRGCNTFIEGNTYDEILYGAKWAGRAWAYADRLYGVD